MKKIFQSGLLSVYWYKGRGYVYMMQYKSMQRGSLVMIRVYTIPRSNTNKIYIKIRYGIYVYLFSYISIDLSISMYLYIYLSKHLHIHLSICRANCQLRIST